MQKEIVKEYLEIINRNDIYLSPKVISSIKSDLHDFFFKLSILGSIKKEPNVIDIEVHNGKWLYPQRIWTKKTFVKLDNKVGIHWICANLGYDCKPLEELLLIQEKYKPLKKTANNKKLFMEENKEHIRNLHSLKKVLFLCSQYRVQIENETYYIKLDGNEALSWLCSSLGYI